MPRNHAGRTQKAHPHLRTTVSGHTDRRVAGSRPCCYSDQRWERIEATAPGVCALSGIPFAPRQTVFRPVGESAPLNEAARIAESSIAHVAGIDYAAA
jgi:hypothetical protein